MIDLSDHIERRKIVSMIESDVEAYCRKASPAEHRSHLGASVIGDPCAAKAWNSFRWLKLEQHQGRMRRLFERGHLEESRFVKILKGIGFDVREFADDRKQFRVSGINGHFGGSLDGMAMPPARYSIDGPILLEFKTHNDKSFKALKKDGVRIAKPVHFAQMSAYGRAYSFRYGLYVAVNKDTDELHFEIIPLDWTLADDLFRKAEDIISSQSQPAKIAQTETYFACKYCHFSGVCFRGELPEKNCRSCKFAVPVEGGNWECVNPYFVEQREPFTRDVLSAERIATGCDHWQAIINA